MSTLVGADANSIYYDDPGVVGIQRLQVGIKTVRKRYVVTQADIDAAFTTIPVTWPVPFDDSNYTLTWGIVDIQNDNTDADYIPGDTHSVIVSGFSAVVLVGVYAIPVAGEIIIINAIGIHD